MKIAERVKKLLILAFVLETLCVTYALYATAVTPFTSILYTFCGLAIATCFLWVSKPVSLPPANTFTYMLPVTIYKFFVIGIILVSMIHFSAIWLKDSPLDFHDADMLPIIKIMCERAMAGNWSKVYDPIPEIWGGIQPIYLPAMWVPFCLPVWLHLDLRWISVISLFVVFAITTWKTNIGTRYFYPVVLSAFILFWWLFTNENAGLIPFTEEGIVILYYVLLVIALNTRKAWLIGVCVSLCMLSRYALIGWVPVMIIYYTWDKQWKNLLTFITTGIVFFILLILLPFGWDTFVKHIALPAEYISFTARVWHDSPVVFKESLGMAKFFGPQQIATLHYLLIFLSFTVPLIFFFGAVWLHKRYHFSMENIPLAALKISLVVFYSFIDVPYLYLFYTSSFVSLIAVVYLTGQNADAPKPRPAL